MLTEDTLEEGRNPSLASLDLGEGGHLGWVHDLQQAELMDRANGAF